MALIISAHIRFVPTNAQPAINQNCPVEVLHIQLELRLVSKFRGLSSSSERRGARLESMGFVADLKLQKERMLYGFIAVTVGGVGPVTG